MSEIYEFVKKTYYDSIFSITLLEENIQLLIYSAVCFLSPFLIGHPQIVVGIIVNAALILSATYLKGYKILPAIMLPSIAVLSRGLVFGPFTMFLIYMIPFIWIGNAVYVYLYKYLQLNPHLKKMNSMLSVGIASVAKTIFLFTAAFVLVKLAILPIIFLTTMGLLQLETAIAGGVIATGIIKARNALGNTA